MATNVMTLCTIVNPSSYPLGQSWTTTLGSGRKTILNWWMRLFPVVERLLFGSTTSALSMQMIAVLFAGYITRRRQFQEPKVKVLLSWWQILSLRTTDG